MMNIRTLTTNIPRKRVSIIGSGPSGFYTAYHLLKKSKIPLHVTIWEKLPVPFGLSRYGVAPDHPEVKNCEETFTQCAEENIQNNGLHKFEFIGGITIGEQISLQKLISEQDAVILSYGSSGEHKLNIPGESDTKGVFTSREFVSWYNGHPDYALNPKFMDFDWSHVSKVGIIGNGNVALDISRVLLSNKIDEIWKKTDINPVAISLLQKAPISNVKIIGRRDFIHSKFTNKELRELWALERYGIRGSISSEFFDVSKFSSINDRALKRRIEICSEYMKDFSERTKASYKKYEPLELTLDGSTRTWELDYLKAPIKIDKDANGNIKQLTVRNQLLTDENKLVDDTSKSDIVYGLDLLITSIGYAGKPMKEFSSLNIKFNKDRVITKDNRVLSTSDVAFPRLYATGWIQSGSQGVIVSTMMNAFNVADTVIADLSKNDSTTNSQPIDVTNIPHTTWKDWEEINKRELDKGKQSGKPREKFLTSDSMYKHN
ncbi:hypothetical protein Kpol_1062p16 [Vanderwaltozyma polyspora DSM 70294]|uniref:NADPH:adrenodoxin oxidoreductase, mitochondrial n=1 Tax=Vanderwaltozyma polyspora (strain ATCC 22028 / DSM 70294 / BCRC 21397 / CBS 2163 / NBRC 10782 / NRRL Y-8283 / UCD 57-17) TaxID=436907 RepID=A7TK73_VANPO|nr:uncharacterized protein Kpol_1062p16 [Vanderwaltozyma polyspora DSM 70294]EDO17308.1 hypothetical protein Kpol_1062p16 [Vanderwaltozyma polyspora DSM 70294]